MNVRPKPMLLLILDGWGYSEDPKNNAIVAAHTPHFDRLWATSARTLISGSGLDVGLPSGQMGNSEVGHLNLGAGRVVYQDYTRITKAISDGLFFDNRTLCDNIDAAVSKNAAVHLMGLLSCGGVHSHQDHLFALIKLAKQRGARRVIVHGFLDGRDTSPRSARQSIEALEKVFEQQGVGQLGSLCGRYFAMDRDKRWNRVEKAYRCLTERVADYSAPDGFSALEQAYQRNESDEFVAPTIIDGGSAINDNDTLVFFNYRADRAREITRAFVDTNFDGFQRRAEPKLAGFVGMTQYAADIQASAAFAPLTHKNVLGEYLQNLSLKQLRIAETEKYAHVTFFFNGGVEQPFEGEVRELIPSPDVATYDLQPEMNAPLMTEKLVAAIKQQSVDVIIGNFANPDMVGHTGNFEATVKAIEAIDRCLGDIIKALDSVGGEMLLTADHGNAEKMADDTTGQAHTAHTAQPVPFIYYGRPAKVLVDDGVLADVAPTLLTLMGLPVPDEMTGRAIMQPQ